MAEFWKAVLHPPSSSHPRVSCPLLSGLHRSFSPSPLWTLLMFESLGACDQPRPLPPPLPVGNQQTGRCEWTVKLYSAACRLPGGRYAIRVGMPPPRAPCPLHSASMSLCSCSRSAPVQPVVAVVVSGVVSLASILSPFPLEGIEERRLLASAPIHPQRACPVPDRRVDGGRRKGLRIRCVHVCGAPRVRADAEGPPGVLVAGPQWSPIRGPDRAPPSLSLPPCPEPLLETPLAASARDMSLEDAGDRDGSCQNAPEF